MLMRQFNNGRKHFTSILKFTHANAHTQTSKSIDIVFLAFTVHSFIFYTFLHRFSLNKNWLKLMLTSFTDLIIPFQYIRFWPGGLLQLVISETMIDILILGKGQVKKIYLFFRDKFSNFSYFLFSTDVFTTEW